MNSSKIPIKIIINSKNFLLKLTFAICLIFYSMSISAQSPVIQKNIAHSPKKATLFSTFLPGLGQAYNKKYWKIPIIYAGIGAFTYFAIDNNNEFNRYKSAYIIRQDGGEDEFFGILNEQALINEMDRWRKFRDYNIIGVVAFYAIQIIDANVDANLFDFDVSDDLSLKVINQNFYVQNTNPLNQTWGLSIVKRF